MTPDRITTLQAEAAAFGRATISAAEVAEIAAMQWRPIETAPKDGSTILVVRPGYYPEVSRWRADIIGSDWPWLVALPGEDAQRLKPTHWMPFPSPPTGGRDER